MIFVGGYENVTEIQRGARHVTCRAVQSATGRQVIIRYFPFEALTPSHIVQLTYEYEQARRIDSVHVGKVYGMEKVRDRNWNGIIFFMEDLPGTPLGEYAARKKIQTREFLDIAIQVARGLMELHLHEIIHSDINPDAIIVDQRKRTAMIRDFGFNALNAYKTEEIHDREVIERNLPYISPEQTGRTSRKIDYRTDFYSLGATLYEVLTGGPPFPSSDPLEIIHAHLAREPRPPSSDRDDVPAMLSSIVMKLLAKDPENRYQSAGGLVHDLRECMERLKRTGEIEIFTPGTNDIRDRFSIPQRLYGRKAETAAAVDCFEEVLDGPTRLLVISGAEGIGKSSLVGEMHDPVTRHRGYFASGTFHRISEEVPYSGIIQAFQTLVRQLLTENEERLHAWRTGLRKALGANGRIITDIMPEAELLIGTQPPLVGTGPGERHNRFHLAIRNFVRHFGAGEHPLVLALEDIQWADAASLNVLAHLAVDPDLSHILFIVTGDADCLGPGRPFAALLAKLKDAGSRIVMLPLEPLSIDDVSELIADTIESDPADCRELSELTYQKTGGNPFFVKQFLRRMHESGILVHSPEGGWRWDHGRVRTMCATDNVIDLIIDDMDHLEPEHREVLKTAAVIGNRFRPETIAGIRGMPIGDVIAALNGAVRHELIAPGPNDCAFSHDRIHQAMLALVPPDELKRLHYRTGRHLLDRAARDELEDRPFAIADHFNQSAELIQDQDERREAAVLNLRAAIRSKDSSAYVSAVRYLERAESFLPPDAWERDYDMAFTLQMEKAEARYLSGSFPEDESPFHNLLARARTGADRARVYSLLTVLRSHRNQVEDAVRIGLSGCRLFGLTLPEEPGRARLLREFLRVRRALKKRSTDDIYRMPEMKDDAMLMLIDLIIKTSVPAYYLNRPSGRRLFFLLILKMIGISLRHGNSKYSAYAYVLYGAMIGARFRDYRAAYDFGNLGIRLSEIYPDPLLRGRIHHSFGAMIAFWCRPFHDYIQHFTASLQLNLAAGDFLYTSFTIINLLNHSFRKGNSIDSLMLLHETHLNFINMSGIPESRVLFDLYYRTILGLNDPDAASTVSDSGDADIRDQIRESKYLHHISLLLNMISLFMAGRRDEAARIGGMMERDVGKHLGAVVHYTEFWFYYALSLSASAAGAGTATRRAAAGRLRTASKLFAAWAAGCPENFSHQHHLIVAELMRLRGRTMDAVRSYGRAARDARRNGYLGHEAIILERAAGLYAGLGDDIAASAHALQARDCYREWGAGALVRRIETEFAAYLRDTGPASAGPRAGGLDYASIVSSLQAVSSEIISDELLKKLMKIALENAGADRGYFISIDNELARIAASTAMEDQVQTDLTPRSLDEGGDLLVPVVNYVMHARKAMVIHDARSEENLPLGEYPEQERPASVLCIPVVRQSKLTGILYLENRKVPGAFTSNHLEILELLAAQAAISLEIAALYEKLTREISQHWKAEAALRDSEDRYRLVVESMNEGICVLDELGNLTFVNTRFCEMIGYDRDEVLAQPLARYVTGEGRAVLRQQLMRRRRGEHTPYEIDLVRKDGMVIATVVSPRPVFDADGRFSGSFGLFTDVTEKKRIEEDLLKASKIESLGVFAGGIAHDFNNLLTAVIGNISLARMSVPSDERIHTILTEAETASLRAKDLTHQLLTFSRGGAPIKKASSMKKLLRQTVDFTLSGSGIVCIYGIQEDLRNAEIDEGQISQVIQNLVINAMQAMDNNGAMTIGAHNVEIDERAGLPLAPGNYIRIDIADQGGGISPEHQKYIFDPYFTTKKNGSGLGLTVSYSVIKRHGGYITFESTPGSGTVFTVYLPSSAEAVRREDKEADRDARLSGRVLVMDDDEVILRVAGNLLKHMGMTADFASHGEEAVDSYRRALEEGRPYDLVIMDLTVPGKMGGKDTIARIREIDPGVRAIVSSGYSNDPVMANFGEYGFRDVVAKPYRIEDLRAVVARVLKGGEDGSGTPVSS